MPTGKLVIMIRVDDGAKWAIGIEFEFSDQERDELERELGRVNANPYKFYDAFVYQVRGIYSEGKVPERFVKYTGSLSGRDRSEEPVVLIKNVPHDRGVPFFDFDEPVRSKYELKNTFVAEGFLALMAELCQTPGIGYVNVNEGDVYQDIYPKNSMSTSQSQKALKEIFFHKDLANHFVRPDQVYMVGMRSDPKNEVYTSFVRNIDVISSFSDEEMEVLRSREFYTPFDDLSAQGSAKTLGDADKHPIISGEDDVRYFENRTEGVSERAKVLVPKINEVLHELKQRLFIEPGDCVITYNNHTVHSKEVVKVGDPEALKTRWIIKTVNVDDVEPHREHLVPGTSHLING